MLISKPTWAISKVFAPGTLLVLLAAAPDFRSQASDFTKTVLAIQQSIQTGDLVSASHDIDDALREHPKDGGLLNLRGIVHAQRNEIQQAHNERRTRIENGIRGSARCALTPNSLFIG
jgi:hypothetical protein